MATPLSRNRLLLINASSYSPEGKLLFDAISGGGDTLTNAQMASADRLIRDLKGESNPQYATISILAKLPVYSGIIGGTGSAHKWNWANPADNNAANRLSFFGGPTHNNFGITNNASTLIDTFLVANTLSLNNTHISIYQRSNITTTSPVIGAFNGTPQRFAIRPRSGTTAISNMYDSTAGQLSATAADALGMTIVSATANNNHFINKNGVTLITGSTSGTLPALKCGLLCYNNAGTFTASAAGQTACWFSIGSGLTQAEASFLYLAVQAYQTREGRQV